ncbi:MAG: hypothetical protein BroJett018_51170 [Chloroflexota bacterium]|nr:MAG: hypothetical protein BroJett018_51170 [Chloroflexota bacterium]
MPKIMKLVALIGFVLLLAACGGEKDGDAQVEAPPRYSTRTPLPTQTSTATPVARPSDTPATTPTDEGSNTGNAVQTVVWNTTNTLGNGTIDHAYWTPDGTQLILSGGSGLHWLSFDPMLDTVQQELPDYFAPLVFEGDGLYAIGPDHHITYLDADLTPTPIDDSAGEWTKLMFSPDDSTLAALGDNEILLIDAATREVRRRLLYDAEIEHLLDMGYAPDGVLLALLTHRPNLDSLKTSDTFLRVVEAESDTLRWSLEGPVAQAARADFNGQYLRVSTPLMSTGPNDFSLRFAPATLYDLTTFQPLESVTLRDYWQIAVSHDGTLMASQSNSNTWLIVQEIPAGRQQFEIPVIGSTGPSSVDNPGLALDMQFSPDDSKLVLLNGMGLVMVVDVVNQTDVALWGMFNSPVYEVVFAPDGNTLAVTLANATRLYPLTEQADDAPPFIPLPQTGRIVSAAYSPDGTRLATGSIGDGALLWDTATGEQAGRLNGVDNSQFLAYSPDGTRLVHGGSYDVGGFSDLPDMGIFRTWDMTSTPLLPAFADVEDFGGMPTAFALSPDGQRLAVATFGSDTNSLEIFDPTDGRGLSRLNLSGYVIRKLEFSTDGQTVYAGGSDGYVRVFEIGTEATQIAEYALPTSAEISALAVDESVLVVGQVDGGLTWLNRADGTVLHNVPSAHKDGVTALAFAADGTLASGGADGLTHLWQSGTPETAAVSDATPVPSSENSAESTRVTYVEKAHYGEGTIQEVLFAPNGDQMVLASSNSAAIYRLPDLETPLTSIPRLTAPLALSPDGTWLVGVNESPVETAPNRRTVQRIVAYSLNTESVEILTNLEYIAAIAFAPDGSAIAVNGYGGVGEEYIEIYSFPAGERLHTFDYGSEHIGGMLFHAPDELLIALYTPVHPDMVDPQEAPVRVIEAFSGEERLSFMMPPLAMLDAKFSPDAAYLHLNAYSMGETFEGGGYALEPINQPLVRQMSDGQTLDLPGETAPIFAFSNNSRLYAFHSYGIASIKLIDIETASEVAEINLMNGRNRQFSGGVNAIWFSPDDTQLAVLEIGGSLTVYDIASGADIAASNPGGDQPVHAFDLSADGHYLVAGTFSDLQLWDIENGSIVAASFAFAPVSILEFAPNGQQVAVGTLGGNGALWNFPVLLELPEEGSGDSPRFLDDRVGLNGLDFVTAVAYTSDGTRLVTAGYYPRRRDDRNPLIRTWDVTTTPMPLPAAADIEDLPGVPSAIALSPDDAVLAVAIEDSLEILLFDAATNGEMGTLVSTMTSPLVDIGFAGKGGRLIALYGDGGIAVFDVPSQSLLQEWPSTLDTTGEGLPTTLYQSMTLSDDGTQLVGGRADGMVTVWDTATGAMIAEFQASSAPITAVHFDAEGQVFVGSQDGVIRVWGRE